MENGSGLPRPKTRSQWDEHYAKKFGGKRRKRNQQLPESVSSSEGVRSENTAQGSQENSVSVSDDHGVKKKARWSEESSGEVEKIPSLKEKGKEKMGKSEESNGEVETIQFLKEKMVKEKMGKSDFGFEFCDVPKGEKENGKGKIVEKTPPSNEKIVVVKEKEKMGKSDFVVEVLDDVSEGEEENGKGKSVEEIPPSNEKNVVVKEKEKMGKSDFVVEVLDDVSEGEEENGKGKSLRDDESDDDEVVFIGETRPRYDDAEDVKTTSVKKGGGKKCGNGGDFSTSGSGSKVGSVGGRSPGVVTYEEVASSTSKRVKETSVSSSEDSEDSEEYESEYSSEEDNDDDSEDEDFIANDSPSEILDVLSNNSHEEIEEAEPEIMYNFVDVEKGVESLKTEKIVKRKGIVSRLRSSSKSTSLKKDENKKKQGSSISSEHVDSDSSLDEEEKEEDNHVEKQKNIQKGKRKYASRNLNVKEILLNTVLEKEGSLAERLHFLEENTTTQLPLKFRLLGRNEIPPEKEEWEIENDNLFADLEMGRLQSEIGSTPKSRVDNGNADDSTTCSHPEGHLRILNEQIGIVCKYCGVVFLEIKYIYPSFANRSSRRQDRTFLGESEQPDGTGFPMEDPPAENFAYTQTVETVWDLVPRHIRERMYQHQQDGFEFMWRNIAGDLDIKNLKEMPANKGKGCIISHAPGTGKTGLSVVFIQSFMKLFPMCRPVVIAPRSMLLTWENEFKKWDVDIPFHNLNNPKLSGKEKVPNWRMVTKKYKGRELNRVLKLFTWANGNGILGLTYRLFEKLAGANESEEDDKVRRILVKYPGLLVLDEGHTPRNDESLMWRALSKVETRLRIILSGTPFQNNFHELYNTLCLVNPEFSSGSSSRKYVQKGKGAKDKWASITSSIANNENESRIEELKQMISPFVHVHKGNILLEKLPGLRDAVVYLKLTDSQQKLLDMISKKNFIEKDNLMTLISVHPSLASEDLSKHDVKALELEPSAGVKTRFVFELITLCNAHSERVIVFSRLIEPLSLIKQQLLHHFKWAENREILYMDGKIDAKYRQDRICAFNNPETEAKVLLASTASCCEGINLVGASRIVLLDVVWNPAITRQAISRAYRLGQTKIVYVYNLISSDFEARKYECQAKKDRMSQLVFSVCEGDHSRTDKVSAIASDDMILDAMFDNLSFKAMFEREPKTQEIRWTEPEGSKPADQS